MKTTKDIKAEVETKAKKVTEKVAAAVEAKAEVKAEEKKEVAPKKTTTVKKAEEVKKEVAPKKTVAKKETVKKETKTAVTVYVQYAGQESSADDVVSKIKAAYEAEGHKASAIKGLKVYVKPEENAAYYVINDTTAGKVDLF